MILIWENDLISFNEVLESKNRYKYRYKLQTCKMQCMNPESLEKLVTMKMPFGKHAGRRIAELPGNYLAWFAREGFPKGEIGELLELMHTLDHNGLSGLLNPIKERLGVPLRNSES